MGFRLDTPLFRVVGAAFAVVAGLLVAVDTMTAIDVGSGFGDSSPLTVALGVSAVVVFAVLWFATDSAFE